MAGSDIRINIIGAFQKKGFNDADKAFNKLQLSAKKLGRTLGLTFSAAAIAAYSKKSIAAANADIKSQRILAQSLKNVGLAYAATDAEGFIERLERQTGILDDELRPAFAQLAQITGSIAQSQKLLSLAFDVSAGSGKDINSVVDILTRAYLGNRKGLKALNLAYTDAELKAMDFSEVLGILTAQYAGSGGASLEGFEGKMRKLNVASSRAAETIGKSLINAIGTLSKDDSIDTTVTKMDNLSKAIGRNIEAVADLIAEIQKIPGAGVVGNAIGAIENRISFFSPSNFMNLLSQVRGFQGMGNVSISKSSQDLQKSIIKAEKAAMDAANKRQKAILASLKKEEEARKKREALEKARKRAATIFDMENIQIVAALQGKIDGEQRARLVALLALNTEMYTAAEKLADIVVRLNAPALSNLGVLIESGDSVDDLIKKLITSQAKLAALQLTAEDFPELENPFTEWDDTLDEILKKLMAMLELLAGAGMVQGGIGGIESIKRPKQPTFGPGSGASDVEWMRMMDALTKAGVPYVNTVGATQKELMRMSNAIVNVTVNGNVTSERDLVNTITEQIYEQQKSGKQIVYSSTGL
jgi:hypothetical protein